MLDGEVTQVRVLVTGGAGFLGSAVAVRLLGSAISLGGAPPAHLDELLLLDLVPPRRDLTDDDRVTAVAGELTSVLPELDDVDAILHLAGVVSGQAEADFDLGMTTNVDGTRALLEWARGHRRPPVLVFTSSLAVFGSDPAIGPVGVVDDDTLPRPQSSYGFQKFIGEQLVADYARRGYVDGRSVRLMTVAVRPGAPNAAASSFLSGIIREPVSGIRAVCPVPGGMPVALSSPRRTVDGILTALEIDAGRWGSRTAMNLPALTTTPAEMVQALDRVFARGASELIDWEEDEAVMRIVGSWPSRFRTPRANRLGLRAPESFDEIVAEYLLTREQPAPQP